MWHKLFCVQRGTRMPGVFLRVCEAKDVMDFQY